MKKILIISSLVLFLSSFMLNAQTNVTFQVDMGIQIANGNFVPNTDTLLIPGAFNDWLNSGTVASKMLTDANGDSVYTITLAIAAGSYEYKYNIGTGWNGKDESSGNRTVIVGSNDTTIAKVYFNNVDGSASKVTFTVDMKLPSKQGGFVPGTDTVLVAGSFNGWSTSATELSGPGTDSTYTVTVDSIPSGSKLFFKFIYRNGSVTWENDPNREYVVPQDSGSFSDFWNKQNPNANLQDGNIQFTVDMSVMSTIGIFDNVKDSAQVRAGFNGWSDSDPSKSVLNQNPLNPNQWFLNVPFVQEQVGNKEYYKFFVKIADTSSIWTDGWERPLSSGGGNRSIPFLGVSNQVDSVHYYDDVKPDWIIPTGTQVSVIFKVDMKPAMDANLQAIPFDATQDTLYWIGEEPAFVRSQGWTDTDEMRVLILTDPDGDKIYTGTLNVSAPSFNSFEYRYGFVRGADASWVFEPVGFGDFAYRVRYVGQDVASSFPVLPWPMPQDTWTNSEDKSNQQEVDPYASLIATSVEDLNTIPLVYNLSQNYPNPFNPTTTIRFSIPKQGLVTLKVYSILGQEVTTLVNSEMSVGTYEIKFDAAKLSSGIYFYRIQVGSFVQSKKMILLK